MHNWETLPSPVAMQGRIESANAWMTTCHALAPSPILKVVGENRVSVHSAISGQSLFSLDWSGVMFVVGIAEGARAYLFHDMKGALALLNAVLLRYVPDQAGPGSTGSAHSSRGRP